MKQFDFDKFMISGYSHFPVPFEVLMETQAVIDQEEWIDHPDRSVSSPKWRETVTDEMIAPPYQMLVDYTDKFINETFGHTFKRICVDMWKGTVPLQYHNCDVNRVQLFLYFGPTVWPQDAGGLLLVKNILAETVDTIEPTFGTAVILNGLTPGYVHAVTELDQRYQDDRIIVAIDYKHYHEEVRNETMR